MPPAPSRLRRTGQCLEAGLGEALDLGQIRCFGQQYRKLVTADPRYRIDRTETRLKPPAEFDQQLIAEVVSMAVVVDLEAIDIQVHYCESHRGIGAPLGQPPR